MIKEIGSDLRAPLKTWISSQLLRCGKNSLLTYHPYAARRKFFSAPCIWANSRFFEIPLRDRYADWFGAGWRALYRFT
jgi:hypothetical protein